MKATCPQESIHRALQITSRIAPTKATALPIIQSTLIRVREGTVQMVATDLTVTVEMSMPATVEREGELAVPNRLLSEFIGTLPHEPVEMEMADDTPMMKLKCGPAKANINSSSANLFPPTPAVEPKARVTMRTEEFRKAVNRVVFCAASEQSRPVLTGILMEIKDDELITAGADGFRMGVQRTPLSDQAGGYSKIVVPSRSVFEVQRMANSNGDHVEITIPEDEKYVRFRIGSEDPQDSDIQVVSTLLVGNFPHYESLIPGDMSNQAEFNLGELQDAMKRAAIFARDDHRTVRFDIQREREANRAIISSESKDVGNNRAELPVGKVTGEDISISFNGRFIQEMLGNLNSKTVRMETSQKSEPAKFAIPQEDDYVHVMMPIFLG